MSNARELSTKDVESVERFIPAPPEQIFDLLVDPARHRDIDGSGTVKDSPEGSRRLTLGDRFGMEMKMGIGYSMVSEVIELEENRLIAWQSTSPIKLLGLVVGGRIWRYELEAREGGTLVRESWDITQERLPWAVRNLRSKTVDSMTKTLERIAQVVEPAT